MKLSLWWSRFSAWPKIQVRNLNILRTRRAFKAKQKAFFTIFKRLSVVKNFLRLDWKCTFKVNHANWKRALINDCLRISKVPRKFYIPTTCNVAIIYPCVKFAIFLKPSLLFNSFYCLGAFFVSHTGFRVNLHSAVVWISRRSLLQTGAISEV